MARCPCIAAMFMCLCNSVSTSSVLGRCHPQTTVELTNAQVFHYNGRCAVAFRNDLPWTKARDFCRRSGGELVKFSSKEDVDTLGSSALLKTCYWIGLNDRQTEGQMLWLDGTGTDLEYMFTVKGPTIFDDQTDCVSFCQKSEQAWMWHTEKCEMRRAFLCEFEIKAGTTPTPTLPASENSKMVTTYAKSDFTTSRSQPGKYWSTGKVASIEASRRDGYLARHRRQQVFMEEDALGDHPYLLAVATETLTSWSAVQCCSRCIMMGGCHIINFNQKLHTCRLFTRRQALYEGTQDIPGWIIYLSG